MLFEIYVNTRRKQLKKIWKWHMPKEKKSGERKNTPSLKDLYGYLFF